MTTLKMTASLRMIHILVGHKSTNQIKSQCHLHPWNLVELTKFEILQIIYGNVHKLSEFTALNGFCQCYTL